MSPAMRGYFSFSKFLLKFRITSYVFLLLFVFIPLSFAHDLSTTANLFTPTTTFKLDSIGEFQHIPGGFTNPPLPGGSVYVGAIPGDPVGKSDGQGLMVVSSPGNVDLFLFPKIDCGEDLVLLRGFVQASSGGASIALAVLDGSLDGSIATNIPVNSVQFQDGYHRMLVLYDPPGTSVIPVFQVANTSSSDALVVYFDNLEVYRLPAGEGIPSELLADTGGSGNVTPTPTPTHRLEIPTPILFPTKLLITPTLTPTATQRLVIPTPIVLPTKFPFIENIITIPIPYLPADSKPLEMVLIPGGTYMMGSPENEVDRDDNEGPLHSVTISKPFYLGKYEITQAQWAAVMGNNPSGFQGNNRPVETITWDDCQAFIQKLNLLGQGTFRLPTEAEWEYACRAGTTTRFYWGDDLKYNQIDDYAWYSSNSNVQTHEVGTKLPNAWGLFDMSGNVWEWCQDRFGEYSSDPQTDPTGSTNDDQRLQRGGEWDETARACRSANRYYNYPSFNYDGYGFRLARNK